tara:strand:+ start:2077 stop:4884 length:2808 start_codon:yes stop_codon:yes gene_type:complete
MSITVTKEGPYFTSGPIKWSELRSTFREDSSGSISASELFRNTNISDRNPIVPDSTENNQSGDNFSYAGGNFSYSGTAKDWKASLMRDSVKRYKVVQSGTDSNFDMGLKSGSSGIDWSGGVTTTLDSVGSVTGNITRNIIKVIDINGSCVSTDSGSNGEPGGGGVGANKKPAAKLDLVSPLKAINVYINNSGSITGAGGKGGYYSSHQTNSDPGKDGGIALKIYHQGSESKTIVNNSGQIFGGGGGGEQGAMGFPGSAGECVTESTSISFGFSSCNTSASCPPGSSLMGTIPFFQIDCDGDGELDTYLYAAVCETYTRNASPAPSPTPGIGGAGGNGEGQAQPRQNGFSGTNPSNPGCSSGRLEGGSRATGGGAGGDGGAYGQAGDSTPGQPGTGGKGGASICGINYTLQGSTGAANIKGLSNAQCDGSAPPIVTTDPPTVQLTMRRRNKHVRFNRPATHLHVTSRHPDYPTDDTKNGGMVDFKIRLKMNDKGVQSDPGNNDRDHGLSMVSMAVTDPTTGAILINAVRTSSSHTTEYTASLAPGSYPIVWTGVHPRNTPTGGIAGVPDDGGSNPQVYFKNDQEIRLVDNHENDFNSTLTILPQNNAVYWYRSWDTELGHGSLNDCGTPRTENYSAMMCIWSQYMRYKAITTDNINPNASSSEFADDTIQSGSFQFAANAAGTYTVKAQSDNNCKFYLDGDKSNSQYFMETTPYDSHGSPDPGGVGVNPLASKPSGISGELGRIWPYTNEGGTGQSNWFNSWTCMQSGAYPMQGPTYWQFNITADETGTRSMLVELVNQPISDAANNLIWAWNPRGVAFQIFDPSGNVVLDSANLVGDSAFGLPEAEWSVTNIDHGSPPDYFQGTSTPLDTSVTTAFPYRSDQIWESEVTDTSIGDARMLPQGNNQDTGMGVRKGMEFKVIANNEKGVVEKKIIIN